MRWHVLSWTAKRNTKKTATWSPRTARD